MNRKRGETHEPGLYAGERESAQRPMLIVLPNNWAGRSNFDGIETWRVETTGTSNAFQSHAFVAFVIFINKSAKCIRSGDKLFGV